MSKEITQTIAEDAVAAANDFLQYERGAELDGGYASQHVRERVVPVSERAQAVLQSVPHPGFEGFYVSLSKHNAADYAEAAAVLPGYFVLVPSALVECGTSVFYPAVVSEDGIKTGDIRLHVLKQPYRQEVRYVASMVLSAAGQSETKGMGEHGKKDSDGLEAEHFATLLAAGTDEEVRANWIAGQHVNHAWRERSNSSVTTKLSEKLFGADIPQVTITVTPQQIEDGKAILLWHEGMSDQQTGDPETATQDSALIVIQGLGYQALKSKDPNGLNSVKELIA